MEVFLITLGAMVLFIFLMAVGIIFGKIKLQGSCGGLNNATGDSCMFCRGEDKCRDLAAQEQESQAPIIELKDYKPIKTT